MDEQFFHKNKSSPGMATGSNFFLMWTQVYDFLKPDYRVLSIGRNGYAKENNHPNEFEQIW